MVVTDLFESEYIPAKQKSDKLMIVLHGKGDSLRPFRRFDREIGLRDFNFLLLNAPKKFLNGYSWYGDPPYEREGVLRIRLMMFKLLSDLERKGWKPENIFFFGFSQGCLVSSDIALHYPKKLGGVIGISGYFHFFPRWRKSLGENKKTPWIFTHGKKDDVLPYEDTYFGVKKLKLAGLKVDWIEVDKKHTLKDEEYPIIRDWVRNQISSL